MATRRGKGGRPKFWTDAHVLQAIRCLARELGRTPSARDCKHSPDAPSDTLVRMRFGTFNAAILAAGLTPNPRGGQRSSVHPHVVRSNHKWVLATIDPEKAAAITQAKMAHWGFRRSHGAQAKPSTVPKDQTRSVA